MIHLNLRNEYSALQWETYEDFHIKGYFDIKLIDQIKGSNGELILITKVLKNANGCFSFIFDSPEYVICGVDRIRSIPLFYASCKNSIIISDHADDLLDEFCQPISMDKRREFIYTGFTTGSSTLHPKIRQVQAGEFIVINKKENRIYSERYFEFRHEDFFSFTSTSKLIDLLDQTYNSIFYQLIKGLDNRCAVIPLSGGYDSSLIAYKLKEFGYTNVICYTYGHISNEEVQISKKTAESLGFKWHFVPYGYTDWKIHINTEEYFNYELFAGNLSSLPHIQDWLAVKKLKENSLIPPDSIFIPGHANDFLAGSHIPSKYIDRKSIPREELISDIVEKHFLLKIHELTTLSKKFMSCITNSFKNSEQEYFSPKEAIDEFEKWDWEERQAKFIANSVRIYDYFQYEWRLPFWEPELLVLWKRIRLEERFDRKLFFLYCTECVKMKNIPTPIITNQDNNIKKNIKDFLNRYFPRFNNFISSFRRYRKSNNVLFGTINPVEYYLGALSGKTHVNSFLSKRYLKNISNENSDNYRRSSAIHKSSNRVPCTKE